MTNKVTIIGAGVVGAAAALTLQPRCHKVFLLDRERPCAGALFVNAVAKVNGSYVPSATQNIFCDVIKMLSQSNSPLCIRLSYSPKVLPWLNRFMWQSCTFLIKKNALSLHALIQHAVQHWRKLIQDTTLSQFLNNKGWLKVYQSVQGFDGTPRSRKLLDQMSIKYQCLIASEIDDLELYLAQSFKHGFFKEDSLTLNDPQLLGQGMVDSLVKRGGHYQHLGMTFAAICSDIIADILNNQSSRVSIFLYRANRFGLL
jgi:D-amino-acid dehydrogenase